MNKYLLLFHLTEAEQTDGQWADFIALLNKGGHLIGGSALAKPSAVKNGSPAPAQSTTVGGYMVILAESLAHASSLAILSPSQVNGGIVEIFHLI